MVTTDDGVQRDTALGQRRQPRGAGDAHMTVGDHECTARWASREREQMLQHAVDVGPAGAAHLPPVEAAAIGVMDLGREQEEPRT